MRFLSFLLIVFFYSCNEKKIESVKYHKNGEVKSIITNKKDSNRNILHFTELGDLEQYYEENSRKETHGKVLLFLDKNIEVSRTECEDKACGISLSYYPNGVLNAFVCYENEEIVFLREYDIYGKRIEDKGFFLRDIVFNKDGTSLTFKTLQIPYCDVYYKVDEYRTNKLLNTYDYCNVDEFIIKPISESSYFKAHSIVIDHFMQDTIIQIDSINVFPVVTPVLITTINNSDSFYESNYIKNIFPLTSICNSAGK